jgi:hypothetical protein
MRGSPLDRRSKPRKWREGGRESLYAKRVRCLGIVVVYDMWDALGLHLHLHLHLRLHPRPASPKVLLSVGGRIMGSPPPRRIPGWQSLEKAVIARSTTHARFPGIQDSALTDLATVLGVGVRSATGPPRKDSGALAFRCRSTLFIVRANWTALFRLRRAALSAL